ncbi:hypothetical protein BKA67DRAFT_545558 [Truncatella angustata]|uniref:DNA mismatch repair protein PMS1 n=1 Tax=Truncatella angustata TaxID=152316 RepID=A0A9P9A2S8_9PEZI|nr:uncharacterized protein BKA67DRAFT_545558 [Truncatella angustata]KAH6659732.1 hypothetical protein BKA67DRAFT_545558 [Truncatella angustata]
MATIKAIEARTIHQIQSGQVIVDLCSVVKELVENSVDAGASSIDVRFKNQGLDAIEVQDNGGGIAPENYETLALKHYTSKLSTYEDLTSLETFGFRGEALSSLCALSKFSVTTCLASDAPKGSKLEFETSGKLRANSVIAAQKGTTVTVEGLFNNLPVRRRELERNIKREWNRVIGVLNQYACILIGVKFSVSQQPNKGKKIVLFSTKGNNTTRENIVNVFGAKTLHVLIPLELELELEPTNGPSSQRWSTQEGGSMKEVRIRGHVSRPAHGEGRQTPDRQMFFVNGRPCGLPQFAKVFNEVYRTYNSSQSPFIFADIQLDTHMYDVNVSPDKRTILLHDQSRLLDNLREALIALFEAQDYSVPLSHIGGPKQMLSKMTISRQNTVGSQDGGTRGPSVGPGGNQQRAQSADYGIPGHGQDGDNEAAETPSSKKRASGLNLVSRWVEGKSNDREASAEKPSPDYENPEGAFPLPREKSISKSAKTDEVLEDTSDEEPSDKLRQENPHISRRVADFNVCMDELSRSKPTAETADVSQEDTGTSDPPIPSIVPPSRTSEIKNIKRSPPKVKRTAQEVATITIDGETVTSLIGSPAKKARTEKPTNQSSRRLQSTSKPVAPIPSFQGRLTQLFSASSTARTRLDDAQIATTLVNSPGKFRSPSEDSDGSEGLFVENDDGADRGTLSPSLHEEPGVERVAEHASPRPPPEQPRSARKKHGYVAMNELAASVSDESTQSDKEYVDNEEEKTQEERRVRDMIDAAEDVAKATSEETQKRQQSFVKGSTKRKDVTCQLLQTVRLDASHLRASISNLADTVARSNASSPLEVSGHGIEGDDAEEKLSLTISKSDFEKMKIVGQFNLGFILAVRQAEMNPDEPEDRHALDDELFIVDQHATDEKYNFERLQATTVVQSQRLVQPKALELTAIEEEVIKENSEALEHNGFQISVDESGYQPVGSRCQLLSLPLSRETTFTLADLEELISLLTDHPSASENTIPRPSKVRKMFAMRACRSSVMIGKSLQKKQMEKLIRHMGELDKPWNCPHGRPTMRHLCGLTAWDDSVWQEGDASDGNQGSPINWAAYLKSQR